MVPEVVSALKMSVDDANKPGMFLLTGSADLFKISAIKESLFELNNKDENIIDMLFEDTLRTYPFSKIEFLKIVESLATGGYPSVQDKSQRSQALWFESYIEARIEKDLSLIKKVSAENKSEINKLLHILAFIISNLLKYSSLSKHLSIKDVTVKSDIEILEALFYLYVVEPRLRLFVLFLWDRINQVHDLSFS